MHVIKKIVDQGNQHRTQCTTAAECPHRHIWPDSGDFHHSTMSDRVERLSEEASHCSANRLLTVRCLTSFEVGFQGGFQVGFLSFHLGFQLRFQGGFLTILRSEPIL